MQSQALLNIKDSNKVYLDNVYNFKAINFIYVIIIWSVNVQEDRERMVVRRFKFEEMRIEQIQDLEVIFAECSWTNLCFAKLQF